MIFPIRRTLRAVALPLLAVLFLATVTASGLLLRGLRVDLTENGLYTLSPGTQRMVDRIDSPLTLKLYYSEQAAGEFPQFRLYAQRVRELLEEVVARSKGKLILEVIDPEPFSEAEDEAAAHGLQAVPLGSTGQSLYFGLVGSNQSGDESLMPFIQPDKETFLEYDLAKLISTLSADETPVLAIMSSLPIGPGIDPTGQPQMGWTVDRQLSEFFEVRRLQADLTAIADDVDVVMLVHPKALSEDTQYAIDQFVLRGGRLLVFVDPDAETDTVGSVMDMAEFDTGRRSDLPMLFKSWGLDYDASSIVLDSKLALQVQPDPNAPPVRHLAVLGLGKDELNQNDVISADLDVLHFSSAGTLRLSEGSPLQLETLAQSSSFSELVAADRVRLARDPGALHEGFKPDGAPLTLAARLTGVLGTAFPDRSGEGHLAQSVQPVNIVVVADTDVLSDRLWVQVQNFLGQPSYSAFANNGDFVYNAVDNLVGNQDLIAVRTRAASQRPFEKVEQMRRSADQRYQSKANELQQQLQSLEVKLAQLQPASDEAGAQPLTAAQQAELSRFQADKLAIRKELRAVQRQLNAEIDRLGAFLKFANIMGVPLLLVIIGVLVAMARKSRRRQHAQ